MVCGKKVIGICITKVHDRTRADFVSWLHAECENHGFKLMVFNSVVDFYNNDAYDEGAKQIYRTVNYGLIDALIIYADSFCTKSICKEIIEDAKAHSIPVTVIGDIGEFADGCCFILREYRQAYKEVINHLINEHGYTDTCFIAGRAEDDFDSQIRIQCYKEVLEENNLAYSDDLIYYGEYWSGPAKKAVEDMVKAKGRPPQAIICANDFMAISVCEKLHELGYSVPNDVAVTGFDGVPDAEYFNPKLTTCKADAEELAKLCIAKAEEAFGGRSIDGIENQKYAPIIGASCGCSSSSDVHRSDASHLFHMIQDMENHESHIYAWMDKLVESADISEMSEKLSQCILPESYICLKSNFITSAFTQELYGENAQPSDRLVVIPQKDDKSIDMFSEISAESIIPELDEWAEDGTAYILSAVFVGAECCGYYALKTQTLEYCAHQMNRISKTINIAMNSALNHLRQKLMRRSIENASFINPVTELPNLRGANKWFEDFSADENNKKKVLAVSIYSMPKYKYIYENYGIKDIEEVLCFVAETLKLANTTDCFIAHVSENEFIIVNYFDDGKDISRVINSATSVFFSNIENYNSSSNKEYFIEINCGCTVVNPGWTGDLSLYTKLASIEMYASRIKNGMGAAVKEEGRQNDFYSLLNALIERNLFVYHFQPIVNAKNGDIYAYEALMRTDPSIGLKPVQVLETAKSYNRLYEIERATMCNAMERYANDFEAFNKRKIFINSIPGYFLKGSDIDALKERYARFRQYFVFEITEQDSISDEELKKIKSFGGSQGETQIAIDDYGTGHSNIVNLLRYEPQFIKIDRFLIEKIEKDENKQMLVRNTIEFAKLNGIKVLAEGVETYDEMKTVINFGVDYIQGFYTGVPEYNPVNQISDEIKQEIKNANPLFANNA